jgi:hypothetical protein
MLCKDLSRDGQPRLASEIDKTFFDPLKHWEQKWDEYTQGLNFVLPSGYGGDLTKGLIVASAQAIAETVNNNQAFPEIHESYQNTGRFPIHTITKAYKLLYLAPNEPDAGDEGMFHPVAPSNEYWPTFDEPPEFKDDWEKKKNWLYRQLSANALSLLRRNLGLKLFRREGSIDVVAIPKDAYTWAVASIVFDSPRQCLRCNKLTGGSKYCSRKCEKAAMSTAEKQDFLDYLGAQHRRGKLTDDEYECAKKRTIFWFEQLDEEEYPMLKDKVLADIVKQWPARDISFLNGHGSKRRK